MKGLCIECGKEMTHRGFRKFCSNACKQRAYRNRRKYNLSTVKVINKEGYLYFIKNSKGLYKIGVTTSKLISYRVVEVAVEAKQRVWLVHSLWRDNVFEAEAFLHHKYRYANEYGEWFSLSIDDLHEAIIDANKFQIKHKQQEDLTVLPLFGSCDL